MPRFRHLHPAGSLLLLAAALHAQAPANDPIAAPAAVVSAGHARFSVLTPQLIRMEWAADNKFEDHASFIVINRRLPVPAFKQSQTADGLTLDTGALHLDFHPTASDTGFTSQNLTITLQLEGKPVVWHPGTPSTGNLLGTTRTLDGARGDVGLKEPIGQGIVSRDGWTVIDDNGPLFDSANFSPANATALTEPWALPRPQGNRQDLYFFGYGHDYRQALADYVRIAGRIPLPPRFAFGTWWSRYWAYSDEELRELVRGFRENNVPLDVFVIDMDWHQTFGRTFPPDASNHGKGWTGYTWDSALFPDPTDFLKEIHDDGLKVTLNLHPASGVQPWEAAYPQFARNMGIDPKTKKYVAFDPTDRKFVFNYFDLLHHPLEHQGVDFWWLDWQQEPTTKIAGVNPTWWLNYLHFTDQEQEGKRPLLFHRWGGLGNHRYQIGFSGDTFSTWQSLAYQPWFTATAANVGYAYWSHDIGGHMPGAVEPELMTRWIQFGLYSPILRTHTTKNPEGERRIWAYPEPYSDIMRDAFQLRSRMQPYLYTEARRTYDTGIAFLHPLYYEAPDAPEAYTAKSEYMFGSELLVAPVTQPVDATTGLANESIWLPKDDWYEQPTGKHFTGPLTVDRSYSIDQVPVFAKAGAIIPQQHPMLHTGARPIDPLVLEVYPLNENQQSSYQLYEDSGHSEDYQHNLGTARTTITAKQSADTLTLTIAPIDGSYDGMLTQRAYELHLPADWPPASITANGTSLRFTRNDAEPGWRFDGIDFTTIALTPTFSVHDAVTITVHRASGDMHKRAGIDGFAGRLHRLRNAYDALSNDYPAVRAVPDAVTIAMQTGNRIGYHPDTAAAEIKQFDAKYSAAIAAVEDLIQQANAKPADAKTEASQKQHAAVLARALADLKDGEHH